MVKRLTPQQARKMVLAVPIEANELAVRIVEAFLGIKRPAGATAYAALMDMRPETADGAIRAAEAAMFYLRECVNAQKEGVQ